MTVLMTPDMALTSSRQECMAEPFSFLDQVACASRYVDVTSSPLSVTRCDVFRQPIHVGELRTFQASVNHTGTSSMGIRC
jgi:acyl-CoA hydrolase